MIKNIDISSIDPNYLCTGCGACAVICPKGAIDMVLTKEGFRPKINRSKCISCGKCKEICTGKGINIDKISGKMWPKNKKNKFLGGFEKLYFGYSNDEQIRHNAASGGIATSVLIYLLEKGDINGAIITKLDKNLKAKTFIARTRKEIISAQTSLYCPTSPLVKIREVKKYENERFAFVGLPCHIHALRALEKKENWVNERIKLSIGLFCSRGSTFDATKVILKRFAKGEKNIEHIKYRGNGWPGFFTAKYKNEKKIMIPLDEYWPYVFAPYFYTPYRCLSCHDMTAELADISLGDAWLKEVKEKDKEGTSIIIARSVLAKNILKSMKSEKIVSLIQVNSLSVINSQKGALFRKKIGIGSRLKLLNIFKKPTPKYDLVFKTSTRGFLGATLAWLASFVSKSRLGTIFIEKSSKKIINLYLNIVYSNSTR